MAEKMVALVYGNDGDDYAKHSVYLVPASKFSRSQLNRLNTKLTAVGVWLEELPIEEATDMQDLESKLDETLK